MNQAIIDSKKAVVSEIAQKMKESQSTVVVEYRGLSVAEVTELRRNLREEGVEFKVYKNSLAQRAAVEAGADDLTKDLIGPNAIAFGGDAVAPARVLAKFAKKHEHLVLKSGIVEGKVVGVVGGGNSALEEAIFLTRFAKKVYLIRRYDYFRGEKSLLDQVEKNEKIEILYNEDLVNVEGTNFVEKAIIKNTLTREEKSIDIDGVFGYIGTEPKTDMFGKYINLTKNGYIITDENMNTNIPGVYAAGDVREKLYRQITTAVADGTIAALEAEKFIISNRSE